MIIVDNALRAREAEDRPIRVALLGAGFMAQGLANQIANSVSSSSMQRQPSTNTNIRSPRRLNGPARMITSENSAG